MNNNDYRDFLDACKTAISQRKDEVLTPHNFELIASGVFRNKEYVKQVASNIRNKFINGIVDNLVSFNKNFSSNGGEVFWCVDYNDFLLKLDKILQKDKVKKVNIFSSYFTNELGINKFFENDDYTVDSQTDDCVIFHPKFGIVSTGSLVLNFNSAYDMELVLNSKTKIFVLPITDFLFKAEESEIFSHLDSIYRSEVDFPYLTSIYTPSPIDSNEKTYFFLVDNGRSDVLENKDIRQALTCINCGACKKVCPVYNIIGDEPYDNVFTGPIANVILPFIENTESYKHLCFSCVSCGNCSAVCPMKIPVAESIVLNKKYFFENKLMDMKDERIAKSLSKYLLSRKKMNGKQWMKNIRVKTIINSKIIDGYKFEKSTFNLQYTDNNDGK